ncbi:L-dopachrome tautomerase yellow-f2-like [Lutzomyia longipalpis]|uniref:L-dopachrome tautomerase yellow-f2-like n=1 Tax=Lutzomyia longipalpis TaxID=7200 RepID=UPI002483E18B|nr:L-dopachrome tautomerase yellow-f2-like [Lutzomyia longipalpis]
MESSSGECSKFKMKIILFGLILQTIYGLPNSHVQEVFKWNVMEYEDFPLTDDSYVGPYKYYIPENVQMLSMGYHPASGLMIMSFLRTRPGVPAALGAFCVTDYPQGSSPKIWKFPNAHVNDLKAADFAYFTDPLGNTHSNPVSNYPYKQWENSFHNRFQKNQFYPFGQFPFQRDVSVFGNDKQIQRIVSVFHITVDERCNRVFFVDNGQLTYNRNRTYVIQKPALVVVGLPANGCQLRNFPIERRVELPDHIIAKGSDGFEHITIDYQPGDFCDDLYLYITNILYNYLTVYDYKRNDFWTFEHETFLPIAAESFFVFDKTFNYQLNLGLASVSLGYPDVVGDKPAYYTNLAGTGQYVVSTKVLKDKSKADFYYNPNDFAIAGYRGCNHQAIKTVIDYTTGVMFFSEVQSNQIRCWNMSKPLNPDYIGVVYESEDYKYGTQMFVDSLGYLWFQSTHIPIVYSTDLPLNLHEVTQKIFHVPVSYAIRGTICGEGL